MNIAYSHILPRHLGAGDIDYPEDCQRAELMYPGLTYNNKIEQLYHNDHD